MKPSSQRALSFLISLFLMLGAIVVYGIFIVPSNNSIQALRGQLVNKQKELKQQEAALKDLNDLLEKFQDLNNAQDLMSFALPNDPNIAQLIYSINGLSKIYPVKIRSIGFQSSVGKTQKQPTYVKNLGLVKLNLSIFSTYDNLKNFLDHVEKNIRIIDINTIAMAEDKTQLNSSEARIVSNGSSSVPSSQTFSISLGMQAYFQDVSVAATTTIR